MNKHGFSLLETLVVVGLVVLLVSAVSFFQKNLFSQNRILQSRLKFEGEARLTLKSFLTEVRSARPSAVGSYPISSAGTSSLIFYSDIDGDNITERIRFFQSGASLKRGELRATGQPLGYVDANEEISTLVSSLPATTSPLFVYYDHTYAGTSSPLTVPVDIASIRLIKMQFDVYQTQAIIRSLKDEQ